MEKAERVDIKEKFSISVDEHIGFNLYFSVDNKFKDFDVVVSAKNKIKVLRNFIRESFPLQTFNFNIEELKIENKDFIIKGWVFSKFNDNIDIRVNRQLCEIKYENRPDVLSEYDEYHVNERTGFIIELKNKKLWNEIEITDGNSSYKKRISIFSFYNAKIKDFFRKKKGIIQETKDYNKWFMENSITRRKLKWQKNFSFDFSPKISIIVPTYNANEKFLSEMIESVLNQSYSNWELCIADGNTENSEIKELLKKYSNRDERIIVKFLEDNLGISGNTNEALKIATGEYIGLLDHDDLLCENALFEIINVINKDSETDFIYTDEDKINSEGTQKIVPHFKPDWSPDLLKSYNYITHFLVFKKELLKLVGNFNSEFDGAQDYDMILRLTEKAEKIIHIPKVLYHWREHMNSTSINPDSKPYAHLAGLKALKAACKRNYGEQADVEEGEYLFTYDFRYFNLNGDKTPKVSIIIPTKDGLMYLKQCVESILEKSTYKNYDIIIMNNNSEKKETYKWFEEIQKDNFNIKVIDAKYEFNWSKLNNHGIKISDAEVFIFLNNDTKIITENWIEILAENSLREEIGTIGAQLLYEDNTIQHAGVVVGMCTWAEHIFKGAMPSHYPTPFVSMMVTRNVLASTGACLAVSKKTLEEIGLFNEEFVICGSDVELSLRAYKNGKYNIYNPNVKLYHYESKTRDNKVPEIDFKLSKIHYSPYRENEDPFFNPNLDKHSFNPKIK